MVAIKSLDKNKTLNIIYDFFKQFKTWCSRSPVTPSVEELEKYLSRNLQMFNNGQLVVKSAANYLDRLKKFQISKWPRPPCISQRKIAWTV